MFCVSYYQKDWLCGNMAFEKREEAEQFIQEHKQYWKSYSFGKLEETSHNYGTKATTYNFDIEYSESL